MSRGRPRTAIGTFGEIRVTDVGGRHRAMTRYRDLDGRLRRVSATAATARAARAQLKERLVTRAGYGSGGLLSFSSPFGDLCDLWLQDLEVRDISEGTKQNYRDDLRLHLRPVLGTYSLGELGTGRIEWFLKREAMVSYSRAKHSRTLLNQLFAFAQRHDAVSRNPVDGTSRLARPRTQVRAMSLDQVQAIRAAAAAWRTDAGVLGPKPDGMVRDVCEVLLGTSMRPGEALALRPCDITDTTRGMVAHVQGTIVRRQGVRDFRQDQAKTEASNRRIAVPDFAAQVIRRRMAEMDADENALTIFHNRNGGVLTLHNLRRTFREFLKDAGLADLGITPRWYRRTGATVLARGLGIEVAAAFLGHTNIAVTEAHYVEHDQTVDRAPAAILEETLRPESPDGRLLAVAENADEADLLRRIDEAEGDDAAA